jgi:hypothetical protein
MCIVSLESFVGRVSNLNVLNPTLCISQSLSDSEHTVECFHEVYNMIDLDEGGTIMPEELYEFFGEPGSPFVDQLGCLIGTFFSHSGF